MGSSPLACFRKLKQLQMQDSGFSTPRCHSSPVGAVRSAGKSVLTQFFSHQRTAYSLTAPHGLLIRMAFPKAKENLLPSARPELGKQGNFRFRDSNFRFRDCPRTRSESPVTDTCKFLRALQGDDSSLQTKWKTAGINNQVQEKKIPLALKQIKYASFHS